MLKKLMIPVLIACVFLLYSCWNYDNGLSPNEDFYVRQDYFKEFILPQDPTAIFDFDEVAYYAFLGQHWSGKYSSFLFAWSVYDESEFYQYNIGSEIYEFQHIVDLLVYNASRRTFYTVNEAIENNLFPQNAFDISISLLDIYIGKKSKLS